MNLVTLATGLAFPEGPGFDRRWDVWFVELEGGTITRWTDTGIERVQCSGQPNGLVVDQRGRIWICDVGLSAIRRFNPVGGT